jgi:glc operon protein GlcG
MSVVSVQPDLTLAEARRYIDRGVAKARELYQGGAFVVMDAGGNVVSISVLEGAIASSAWISRAKAYVSAVQQEPSARRAQNWQRNATGFSAFQRLMRDEIFAGPGAVPIEKNGQIVGALSTGGGLGPWTEIPGLDASALTLDGQPVNAEDMIIALALEIPYENQHPEVEKLVGRRVEVAPDDRPRTLAVARRYADQAIAAATAHGARVGVAVVDELGRLVQQDRMDGAGLLWPDLAEAQARTALSFQCPTVEIAQRFSGEQLAQVQALTRHKLATIPGGVPIVLDGWVVGGIGVCGSGSSDLDATLAQEAISARG